MKEKVFRSVFLLAASFGLAGSFGLHSQSAGNVTSANATILLGGAGSAPPEVVFYTSSGSVTNFAVVGPIGTFGMVRSNVTGAGFAFAVTNTYFLSTYRIEASTNFVHWATLGTVVGPTNGLVALDTNAGSTRFFRVIETLPNGYFRDLNPNPNTKN